MYVQYSRPTLSRRPSTVGAWLVVAAGLTGYPVSGQSLRGSMASVDRQNVIAGQHDYTFLDTGERVRAFASQGLLVRVQPNRDFTLRGVSFP